MKKLYILFLAILSIFSSISTFANNASAPLNESGSVVGKVLDSKSKQPVEYANIAIYSYEDSSLVTGGITDMDGSFTIKDLKPGKYYAIIKFIGYNETLKENIVISRSEKEASLGIINLEEAAQSLNEVSVVADKSQVIYKIDRKVVNPSQYIAAQGGSAIDILANTPSISVDIEGNVSLRGSSNFMVLVNGKPSPFDASEALEQIPASSIDNIEIITNPSAKFDPDGAAGIINIITKKDAQQGWNGVVNANASTLGAYGGDFLFNFSGNRARYYIGGNRREHIRASDFTSNNGTIDLSSGDTSHIEQHGSRDMNFFGNTLKAGMEYDLNDKNTLGLELAGGTRGRRFPTDLITTEWSTNGLDTLTTEALGKSNSDEYNVSFTLSQYSQFGENKDHKLESSLQMEYENGDGYTESKKYDGDQILRSLQQSWETNEEKQVRLKTDYTRPWEKGTFEAGYQLRYDYELSTYNAAFDSLSQEENAKFDNESEFTRLINGAYVTFSGEWKKLGYKAGLRAEHTLRRLDNFAADTLYEINRLDFYPSVHLSYNMRADQSVMASYSRRIDRPRGWQLDPYLTWRDPNTVRTGNPGILPQYVNSYEVSYQKKFGINFVSVELFHRHVENKIERVPGKYSDGVILNSHTNVGQDYSTGAEAMVNFDLFKWWQVNWSASVYDYRMDVLPEFEANLSETQSTNWSTRISNTFKPTQTLRIQFDAMYDAPSVTATGTRSAMAFSSLAVKQSFFKRKLEASVSVRDIFNTAKMESSSNGAEYYSNTTFDMKSPVFQFTLSYRFNNYKPERNGQQGSGDGGMDMQY